MVDMYGNYELKEGKKMDPKELGARLVVSFTMNLEHDRPNDHDPAFGTVSVGYLVSNYGEKILSEIYESFAAYVLAYKLCLTVAGKNVEECEEFSDNCARLHQLVHEHPEAVGVMDTDDFKPKQITQEVDE